MPSSRSRRFDPRTLPDNYSHNVTPKDIIYYDEESDHYCFSADNNTTYFPSTLIAFIDGACIRNGDDDQALAGYGVYFGPRSRHNQSAPLSPTERHTSQRAELHAALGALDTIRQIRGFRNGQLDHVVLVTDSAYVTRSMSEFITEWRRNGYRTYFGDRIRNRDIIQALDEEIKAFNEGGISVQFWQIPREWNQRADRLAKDGARMA